MTAGNHGCMMKKSDERPHDNSQSDYAVLGLKLKDVIVRHFRNRWSLGGPVLRIKPRPRAWTGSEDRIVCRDLECRSPNQGSLTESWILQGGAILLLLPGQCFVDVNPDR